MQLLWSLLHMTLLYTGTDRALVWWDLSFSENDAPKLVKRGELIIGEMPSFVAFSRTGRFALAIAEGSNSLSSLAIAKDGALSVLDQRSCPGGPAYVSLTPDERWVLVASYGSGELRTYPVDNKGRLGECACFVSSGAMSHCAVRDPEQNLVYVPSKGTDSIFIGRLDEQTGHVSEIGRCVAPVGSGPRHLVFSPDGAHAYLANENDCSLLLLERKPDAPEILTPLQHSVALPRAPEPGDSGADVRVSRDGQFVYMSVRGHDSIAAYKRVGHELRLVEHVSTQGKVPRNFCLLDDDLLLVANQESCNLAVFLRNSSSGKLNALGICDTQERTFWVGAAHSY